MDDLDRLYDRLVASIREGFPHLLDRAFQLGDIQEHLVPYRLNRRELGFDSVRQYELALMRLASGERGYVRVDAAVSDALRRALQSPEPDAALLRDHARTSVALAQGNAATSSSADARRSEARSAEAGGPPPLQSAPQAPVPPPIPDPINPPDWGVPANEVEPVPTPPPPPAPVKRQTGAVEPRSGPTIMGGPCRYCSQPLPEGRAVTYCPSCGQNVTVRHCPACSTELEIDWRFCITCGRAMDESALGEAS